MSKIEINLSERDRRRLLKHYNRTLDTLDYSKILHEVNIECYNENIFKDEKKFKSDKRQLSIIKNDIKMFEKLKKTLEVKDEM